MSQPEDSLALPDDFHGFVRLFPLPNLVMFPHVMQPLHIFEPRYREMMEDALAGDQLIAMTLLKPGWEPHYEGRPPIEPVVCIGRIIAHSRLPDGTFNLLLLGLRRARITVELDDERSFRRARVELLEDAFSSELVASRGIVQQRLLDLFRKLMPDSSAWEQQVEQLLSNSPHLGMLTDLIAFTTSFGAEYKQQLLAETNVDRRAAKLVEKLEAVSEQSHLPEERSSLEFPPPFSDN